MGWVGALSIATLVFLIIYGPSGIHKVEEGHVGVYFFGGALLSSIAEPGYHWKSPLTSFLNVQVTLQTDEVKDIPCGTSGGVMLYFDKIEVVNRLNKAYVHETIKNYTINYDRTWIYDKIHHAVNEFCSVHTLQEVYIEKFDQLDESLASSLQKSNEEWAPGIEIVSIRVTKPRIPEAIRANFERMEAEKTKLLITAQTQRVRLKEAETAKVSAIADANKQIAVAKINAEKEVTEKRAHQQMSSIQHDMFLQREKMITDSSFYQQRREAEANELLLTSNFLQLQRIRALLSNSHIFYGDRIPSSFYMSPSFFTNFSSNSHATTAAITEHLLTKTTESLPDIDITKPTNL